MDKADEYDLMPNDGSGRNPLHQAIANREKLSVIEKIYSRKPSFAKEKDAIGDIPLFYALELGDIEISKFLIRKRKDLNLIKNNDGAGIWHKAVISGNVDLIKKVLDWRLTADKYRIPMSENDYENNNLIHYILTYTKEDKKLKMLKLFPRRENQSFTAPNDTGVTPLHLACTCGYEVLEYCLGHAKDVLVRDIDDLLPLHYAEIASDGHRTVTLEIIEKKTQAQIKKWEKRTGEKYVTEPNPKHEDTVLIPIMEG